jgi:hypothetical protein
MIYSPAIERKQFYLSTRSKGSDHAIGNFGVSTMT